MREVVDATQYDALKNLTLFTFVLLIKYLASIHELIA